MDHLARSAPRVSANVVVHHCGRDWNLGDLTARGNWRLWRYKLHHFIHHRKEC
jgi:hypothetical protein